MPRRVAEESSMLKPEGVLQVRNDILRVQCVTLCGVSLARNEMFKTCCGTKEKITC